MAGKFLEVAVILTAMDRMSGVVNSATGKASAGFNTLANSKERADKMLSDGLAMGAGGMAGIAILTHFANKYGDIQEAQQDLRAAMMGPGGILDEKLMGRINAFSVNMSKKYAGSQMDYIDMIRIMKQNRLNPDDMLGGTGEAVSKLAELFKMQPGNIGLFASRMRNDMRVPVQDMEKMADLMARLNGAGVGTTGAETVEKLTELFSKAGLGASNLRLFGVQNAKDMGALGGMFLSKGLDAASVGTTFRRIFDNIADPKKLKKMNDEAAIFGKHLEFYDKAGNFKGIPNMVAQLSTLQKLTAVQRASVLDPFGSKQGLGGDVMKQLANFGLQDFQEYQDRLERQGTLTQKVTEIQRGLNQQERIAGSNIDNLSGAIGKSYNPALTMLVKLTGKMANVFAESIGNHPYISGIATGLVGIASAGMVLGGAIKLIGYAWIQSGMGAVSGAIMSGIATAWGAAATAAEGFAMVLLTTVVPAISAVASAIAASGILAIAAPLAAVAALLVYENNRSLNNQDQTISHKAGDAMLKNLQTTGFKGDVLERSDHAMKRDRQPTAVTYSPTIHIHGNGDAKNISKIVNDGADKVLDLIKQAAINNIRVGYH